MTKPWDSISPKGQKYSKVLLDEYAQIPPHLLNREKCETCKWYVGRNSDDDNEGNCHRYPPKVDVDRWNKWVPVHRADFCGEWKSKVKDSYEEEMLKEQLRMTSLQNDALQMQMKPPHQDFSSNLIGGAFGLSFVPADVQKILKDAQERAEGKRKS